MRKHFLILMLLTLLPLAGWAEGVNMANFEFLLTSGQDYYYTGATPTITATVKNTSTNPATVLVANTDYELKFYKNNVEISAADVKAVGTYSVQAHAKSVAYTGHTAAIEFNIVKVPLRIEGEFVQNKDKKVYAAAEPEGNLFTVTKVTTNTGAQEETVLTETFAGKLTFARDFESVLDPAGDYALIGSITDDELAANYTVPSTLIGAYSSETWTQALFKITQKAFTIGDEGTVTINVAANLTYNGQAQKATVTVTDKVLGALTEATYFTAATAAAYNTANPGSNVTVGQAVPGSGDYYLAWANNINAKKSTADGAPQVTVKGMGNYADGSVEAQKFTIKQATLIVTPSATKVYSGDAAIPALPTEAANPTKSGQIIKNDSVTFAFQGFVNDEDADIITINTTVENVSQAPALAWKTASKKTAHVGENYAIKFSNTDINKCFATTNNNYYFYANEGTFAITKRDITVTVADKTLKHGDDETYTVTPAGHVNADATAIKNAIKVVRETPVGVVDYDYDLNAVFMTDTEIDTSLPEAKRTAAKNAVKDYTITAVTKGKLTLENEDLTIAINETKFTLTKVYDGEDINITTDIKDKANLIIIGLKDQTESVDLSNLTLTAVPNANGNIKDAGTYQLVLDGASIEGYDITYVPSQYKITKRPIQLTIAKQSFQTGTVPNVAQNYTIETILDANEEPLAEQRIADTDKAADVFKLGLAPMIYNFTSWNAATGGTQYATGTAKIVAIDANKTTIEVLTNEAYNNAISADDAAAFVGNLYTVATTSLDNPAGRLKLTDVSTNSEVNIWVAPTYASGVKVNANGEIAAAASDDAIANGIVAVDPETEGSVFANYEFSYSAGSGAVQIIAAADVALDEKTDLTTLEATAANATANVILISDRQIKKNVWSSLVLPFNTTVREVSKALGYAVVDMFVEDPNSDAMNFKLHMGEIPAYTPFLVKTDETINLNTVVFQGVQIVALTNANRANLTQSNKSYNFNGNMKYDVIGEIFWSDGSKMTEDAIQFNKYAATAKCRAMKAYITAKPGVSEAPAIFIEEPDGSTTAINAITSENVKAVKEGWYTLNGVKLQAAPTQKGIYINNGKKVVIK